MIDYHFYHSGDGGTRGVKAVIAPIRRVLRRILRPYFVRQVDLMESLDARVETAERRLDALDNRTDRSEDKASAAIAFGWDYVAMTRRLAALEDALIKLQDGSSTSKDAEGQLTLPLRDAAISTVHAQAS